MSQFCEQCEFSPTCKIDCPALIALNSICNAQVKAEREAIARQLAKDLGVIKFELDKDLEALGERVLNHFDEFAFIRHRGVKIAYLWSYDKKQQNGKSTLAECRIVKGVWTAFLPYDFIITFFKPSLYGMSDNQLSLIMLHELKHIGLNHKGYYIVPHDIEDFADILSKYGLGWSDHSADVPDIFET